MVETLWWHHEVRPTVCLHRMFDVFDLRDLWVLSAAGFYGRSGPAIIKHSRRRRVCDDETGRRPSARSTTEFFQALSLRCSLICCVTMIFREIFRRRSSRLEQPAVRWPDMAIRDLKPRLERVVWLHGGLFPVRRARAE